MRRPRSIIGLVFSILLGVLLLGMGSTHWIWRGATADERPLRLVRSRVPWILLPLVGGVLLLSWGLARLIRRERSRLVSRLASPVPLGGAQTFDLLCLGDRAEEAERSRALRRRLEARLHNAQHLEAVGKLAGGVAHHLNNNLQVILGFTNLVLEALPPDTPDRKDLEEVAEAARQSIAVTRQLITFSRGQNEPGGTADLNDVVRDMLKVLESTLGKACTVELVLHHEPVVVRLSRAPIEQVLTNLCLNARDAMIGSALLKIETRRDRPATGNGALREGGHGVLLVTDTGQGIDGKILDRIFDPFFSTKDPTRHTGLGLSTTYGIVRRAEGWIDVSSSPGAGSTFSVFLPLAEDRAAPSAVPETARTRAERGHRILVVDDHAAVRTLNRSILEDEGNRVVLAEDGREALELLAGDAEGFDLALVDVVMPRIGGEEFLRLVTERHPRLRLLFTSAYDESADQLSFLAGRNIALLHKPYYPHELCEAVRRELEA